MNQMYTFNIFQTIWNILKDIYNAIIVGVGWIESIAAWIVEAITWIGHAIGNVVNIAGSLPTALQTFIYVTLIISVIYMFLGWAGGDSE